MSNQLKESVDTVIFRLESFMREADIYKSTPSLHMNADALVIEYTDWETGHKRFEKISDIRKNNS